jgi:DNA polymerase epsilon subunit 3
MPNSSNEIALSSGKKTISPQDVMEALKDCEFEDFLDRLHQELRSMYCRHDHLKVVTSIHLPHLRTKIYVEYSDIQCNKRNTYRRKVKEEKQAASQLEGDQAAAEGDTSIATNGELEHAEGDDADRPIKKLKADDGTAVDPDTTGLDDEDMEDEVDDVPDGDDQADDEGDDEVEDEMEDEEDEEPAEVAREADDEVAVGGMRDEALDDPGSESD